MKRFIIKQPVTLSITLLFFTSFAISLYGMKAGESGAAAPAAPPSAVAPAPEAGVSAEADEDKEAYAKLVDDMSKFKAFDESADLCLNYLFFENPYHLGSIQGIFSGSTSNRHKLFYCSGHGIDAKTLETFLLNEENFPCRFWVHKSQSNVAIQLAARPHYVFPQKETPMIVNTREFKNSDLKDYASCSTMSWDELDIFAEYSVAGFAADETAENQKIFINHVASSIPRERIRFYRAGSGKNIATCLAIAHDRDIFSLHFLPTRSGYCDIKTIQALIQYAVHQTKAANFFTTLVFVREDFYDFFAEMGFKPIAERGYTRITGKNSFLVHHMFKLDRKYHTADVV